MRRLSNWMWKALLRTKCWVWKVSRANLSYTWQVLTVNWEFRHWYCCLSGFFLLNFNKELKIKVFFPELEMTVHHQKLDYTADQLFSELGGAAGLVLGLSLITIVRQIDDCISAMIKWAKKLRTKKSNGVNRSSQERGCFFLNLE